MNATDHRRAMQLFQEAVERDAAHRDAFLRDSCGDDETLRAEVDSLLSNHDTQTLIADRTAPSRPWTPLAAPDASTVLTRLTPRLWRQADPGWRRVGLILLAFPLVMLAGEYWLNSRIERVLRENLESQLQATLGSNVAAVANWLQVQKHEAQEWAEHPHVREHFPAIVGEAEAPDATLERLRQSSHHQELLATLTPLQERDDVRAIHAVNTAGQIVFASRDVLKGRPRLSAVAASWLGPVLMGKTVLLPPVQGRALVEDLPPGAEDAPIIVVGAPIRNEKGAVIGGLFVSIESGMEFTRLLDLGRAGPHGDAYAFGPQGQLLSASGFEPQLRAIGLTKSATTGASVLHVQVRDPGVDLTAGRGPAGPIAKRPLTRMAAAAVAGTDGVDIDGYRDYRGVPVVGAWDWLDDYGFGVAAEIDYDTAFAPIAQVRSSLWILSGLLTALGAVALAASLSTVRLRREVGEARKLGQYTLEEKIGAGGMGTVYKAHHALLRRPTAVKVLNGNDADSAAVARFEREVQIASSLTHPNTVEIYDYGRTDDGVFYFAMEYLPGVDLEKLVQLEGAVPPARVIHVLAQVLGSLAEAHALGMVHRDVKPANIILGQRGGLPDFVKLVDFGIAKEPSLGDSTEITNTGLVSGTPLYIAPECLADPAQASAQSDLYALGVVAFYLLTGRRLFTGASAMEILNRVMNEPPRRPSDLAPTVPPKLDDLVYSCLAKDPAQRPDSAREMLTAVTALAAEHPWSETDANRWWREVHERLANIPASPAN